MNKTSYIVVILFGLLLFSFRTIAQTPEGEYVLNDRNSQKKEIQRLLMKDDLKLSDAKFDSVLVIEKDYLRKGKQVKILRNIPESQRRLKLRELTEQRKKRWKSAGLDENDIRRIENYYNYHPDTF